MERKDQASMDYWTIRILLGIAAFFLTMTFLTVQKTSDDVNQLKETVSIIQYQYNSVNTRLEKIENKVNNKNK